MLLNELKLSVKILSIQLVLIKKFQISNSKSQIISNDQNTKFETKIGPLNLLINRFRSLRFQIFMAALTTSIVSQAILRARLLPSTIISSTISGRAS